MNQHRMHVKSHHHSLVYALDDDKNTYWSFTMSSFVLGHSLPRSARLISIANFTFPRVRSTCGSAAISSPHRGAVCNFHLKIYAYITWTAVDKEARLERQNHEQARLFYICIIN